MRFNFSNILAVISIIVAISTLIYTVFLGSEQIKISIEHNKLSVIPKISTNIIVKKGNDFSGIGIINDGLGPAIIRDVKYYDQDKEILSLSVESQLFFLKKYNMLDIIDISPLNVDTIVKTNEKIWLYKTKKKRNNKNISKKLFSLYANNNIAICYCSLYKECQIKVISGSKISGYKYIDPESLHCSWSKGFK